MRPALFPGRKGLIQYLVLRTQIAYGITYSAAICCAGRAETRGISEQVKRLA